MAHPEAAVLVAREDLADLVAQVDQEDLVDLETTTNPAITTPAGMMTTDGNSESAIESSTSAKWSSWASFKASLILSVTEGEDEMSETRPLPWIQCRGREHSFCLLRGMSCPTRTTRWASRT